MITVKIVTFVPLSHTDIVRQAMGDAGAGKIGNYTHCSFSSRGVGRYIPGDNAQPFIGVAGQFESVEEERIEMVCERSDARTVIAAMKSVHPYEEAAYDIYELLDEEKL
jgi:hypothetical protein